jgi:hypothetical protein
VTFLEAALVVLKEAREPLTSDAIVRRALDRGLLSTAGKTPEASMSAARYGNVNSDAPRVRWVAKPGRQRAVRGSVRWTLMER